MKNSKAKITYLFHSGYAVETTNHFLIFDYYQPFTAKEKTLQDGVITGPFLAAQKNIYVFSSHSHGDHFDPIILSWATDNPAITYILSDDIVAPATLKRCRSIGKDQTLHEDKLLIRTIGSTDEGVAFLVEVDGLTLFHAGDLNWWHWKGESSDYLTAMEQAFKLEVQKLTGEKIDIAFFPVDRRLEEHFSLGAEYFAAAVKPQLLLPMHFGKDYGATQAFADKLRNTPVKTEVIHRKGQVLSYSLDE